MAATLVRRAYWGVLTVGFVLVFSLGLLAQSRQAAAPSAKPDLNSTLADLTRVAPATVQDLNLVNQQQAGGRLHWVMFWREEKAQNARMSEALRRNLQFAVPDLIKDAQASGGSLSTTFKLYNDLTVVCESLTSLLQPGSRESNLTALNYDLSDMNRLRDQLSSYIQQAAASIDSNYPQPWSSAGRPKRIIVDDDVPENPAPRKRRASTR